MGLLNLFNKTGDKKNACTAMTTGMVVGVSAVQVNKMHLPIVEYEVKNEKYQIRMAYQLAKKLEKESIVEREVVRASLNYGNNLKAQVTKLQGMEVKVSYNPENPKEAVVVE